MRAKGLGALLGLSALLLLVGTPPLAAEGAASDPLSRLALEDGLLAWDGLRIGMSLVQAERKIGVTLALDRNRDSACPVWVANADFHGQSVTVGFPSPKPGAKIQWIRVTFRGSLVQFGAAELVSSLHGRLAGAVFVPPAEHPDYKEAEDVQPDYTVEGKQPQSVRIAPREWMILAARDCMD